MDNKQMSSPKIAVQRTLVAAFLLMAVEPVLGDTVTVRNAAELRDELRRARPGTTIRLAQGDYGNGVLVDKVKGTKDRPILITGADEGAPPLFEGGKEALHFVDCSYVTLRNVRVSGSTANGINADDGGSYDSPSVGMVFENLVIENIGPTGNRDGLKLSGLNHFTVRNCRFSGWGGSAIDMVGCHEGVIDQCRFVGKEGYSQATGIQAKGGSESVSIRRCFFKNAGQRAINLGGSTGLRFFRPKLRDYEAKSIVVEGNHFVGSMAPVAYVTSVHCQVRRNTIVHPEKWVLRILQEQPTDAFQPCQQGVFEANLVVFDQRVRTFANVGPNTRPETFSFRKNAWFCSDGDRRPALPSRETEGVYQVDPKLENAGMPGMRMTSKDPRLREIGAHAFRDDPPK